MTMSDDELVDRVLACAAMCSELSEGGVLSDVAPPPPTHGWRVYFVWVLIANLDADDELSDRAVQLARGLPRSWPAVVVRAVRHSRGRPHRERLQALHPAELRFLRDTTRGAVGLAREARGTIRRSRGDEADRRSLLEEAWKHIDIYAHQHGLPDPAA